MNDTVDKAVAWDEIAEKNAEIARLQEAKRHFSALADAKGKENVTLRQEIERLRATIKQAHLALTKSSLTPDERVYDATLALARSFQVEFQSNHQMGAGHGGAEE